MTGIWLISYIALWILFLVVAMVLLIVLRNLEVIYESLAVMPRLSPPSSFLKAGQNVPIVNLKTLGGGMISLSEFRGAGTAFLVVSPNCPACYDLLTGIVSKGDNLSQFHPTVQRWVVLSLGDISGTTTLIRQTDLAEDIPVLIDAEAKLKSSWGISATPITVIVDEQFRVLKQIVGHA